MERYDFLMARARAIVERRHQEELEDGDMPIGEDNDGNSDAGSEFSVLASSQFDGMGGIEYSGSTELGSNDDSFLGIAFSPRKTRSRYRNGGRWPDFSAHIKLYGNTSTFSRVDG
jgi:hypothetical protein